MFLFCRRLQHGIIPRFLRCCKRNAPHARPSDPCTTVEPASITTFFIYFRVGLQSEYLLGALLAVTRAKKAEGGKRESTGPRQKASTLHCLEPPDEPKFAPPHLLDSDSRPAKLRH